MRSDKEASAARAEAGPAVDDLKHDIARTQYAVDSVHGTLALVVDRLAKIEADIRAEGERRAAADQAEQAAFAQGYGRLAVRAVSEAPAPPHEPPPPPEQPVFQQQRLPRAASLAMPEPAPAPSPQAPQPGPLDLHESQVAPAPRPAPQPSPQHAPAPPQRMQPEPPPAPRRRAAAARPINPDMPPDLPLEPGSGPPQFSARIAASEAALGDAVPAEPGTAGGKSSFIAAARRAARAALQQAPRAPAPRDEAPQHDHAEYDEQPPASVPGKLMKRMKSLFVAAGIIALVAGGVQILGSKIHLGGSKNAQRAATGTLERRQHQQLARDLTQAPIGMDGSRNGRAAPPLAPPPTAQPTAPSAAALENPALWNSPNLGLPPKAALGDITGSIDHNVTPPQPATQAAGPDGPHLPLAIGGPKLRRAAAAGNPAAEYEVAVRFADGRGVPTNLKEAAHWFERAARAGLAPAEFRYASMLEKGHGVAKDLAAARKLYRAAAAKGNAKAMHNLAVLYAEGINGKPDYNDAVTWFRKAARRGVSDSQYNLGVLCARGLGTDKSFVESYKWFALAAAKGDPESARKRDEVAQRLDGKELAEAKQAVASFKPEQQPSSAINAPKPRGGWDTAAAGAAGAKTKAPAESRRRPQARPQAKPQGPLSLGSFTVGKR